MERMGFMRGRRSFLAMLLAPIFRVQVRNPHLKIRTWMNTGWGVQILPGNDGFSGDELIRLQREVDLKMRSFDGHFADIAKPRKFTADEIKSAIKAVCG